MKNFKKTIASFLSVMLIMTIVQVPVFAANYNASQIVLSVEQLVGLKNKTNSDLRWVEQQFSQHYGIELEGENCCVSHVAEYMIDSTSDKKIPLGAVVFFEETFIYDKEDNEPVNHIGIHIGDNYIVHAFDWDSQGTVISKDKISSLIRSERYNFKGWGWFSDVELEDDTFEFTIKNPDTYPKFPGTIESFKNSNYPTASYYVLFVQEGLQALDFDVINNGIFDSSTIQAVKAFQSQNNLKANGVIDNDTWGTLCSLLNKKFGKDIEPDIPDKEPIREPIKVNFDIKNSDTYPKMRYDEYYFTDKNDLMSGQDVAFIQAGLQDLGFDVAINGYFDYSTEKVVSVFQRQNYLKGNGVVDRDTWRTIVSLLEKKYQKDIAPEVNVKFDIKNPNTYPKMVRDYYTYYKEQTLFGEDIAFIQTGLQDLGYDVVINGYYDYSTAKVVQVFQEQHNMKSNGVFEQETWKVLVALLEEKYEKDITFDKELPIPDIDNPFKDVQYKDYFYAPVLWAYDNEITKGMSDIDFVPYGNCTRGQAVTFLWRAAGSPEPQTINNLFVDISPEDYFYKAVLWAIENGITAGTGGDYFSPNIKCSNAHILTFLWRTMGKPYETDTDIWYEDAVNWANKTDLIKGTDLNDFDPNSDAFRANIVTYLYKYFEGADIK